MLGYVKEEILKEEEEEIDEIDHDLTAIGTEVEVPTTIDCDKYCTSPECKVFIQSKTPTST